MELALVSLIPKGDSRDPKDLRPISVMSTVYRLWAATRLHDIRDWTEQWLDGVQHGARRGHGTEDIYWDLALKVENAMLEGSPLYGLSLDYAKCFDRLPHGILLQLIEELGLPDVIVKPLRT
eukprot:6561799-Karenia_brevis.AAC.1